MPRIDSSNIDTGAFCLVFKYLEKLRPTCIVSRLGKIKRANHALDIQIFVSDLTEAIHQIKSRLVVKIFSLVGDVLVKLRKGFHGCSAIRSTLLFSSYRALKPSEFLLRLSVVFERLDFLAVGSDEERLQSEVDPDFRIFRGNNFNVFKFARENDEPAVGLLSEGDGLDFAFDFPMQFEFHVSDALKPGFVITGELGSVSDGELYGIKPAVAFKPGIARFLSSFQTTEESLKSAVESFQSSLAGTAIRFGERIFDFTCLSELLRLLRVSDTFSLSLVNSFSLFKSRVVQIPMRFQKIKHFLCLFFRGIRSKFERLVHQCLYYNTKGKPGKEAGVFLGNQSLRQTGTHSPVS